MMPLAWIPNVEGFRFIGVRRDMTRIECHVVKDEQGLHRVNNGQFKELIGWFNLPREVRK
jgi:hypothetical protein